MQTNLTFDIKPIEGCELNTHYKSNLIINGLTTSTLINGINLKQQIRVGDAYLLVTTYDTLDGDTTYFTLLNLSGEIIDSVQEPKTFSKVQGWSFAQLRQETPNTFVAESYENDYKIRLTIKNRLFSRNLKLSRVTLT